MAWGVRPDPLLRSPKRGSPASLNTFVVGDIANFVTTGSGPLIQGDPKAFRTEGVVTLFLEREDGVWKIALGHTSARFGDR